MYLFHLFKAAILMVLLVLIPLSDMFAQDPPHRDQFRMNSISGGDFRDYISDHITEDELWAYSMLTFGSFHNMMHEMMTELVLYDKEQLDGETRLPDFDERISGGQWGDYRENIERADVPETWYNFVHITEIMHDRVHHAMYKSVLYDMETNQRDVDLDEYIEEDRAPYTAEESIPERDDLQMNYISTHDFRMLAWHEEVQGRHLHTSLQQMSNFAHLLDELLTLWAEYASGFDDTNCRPGAVETRISTDQWVEYSAGIHNCGDERWQELIQVATLVHGRIHHMMHAFAAHINS